MSYELDAIAAAVIGGSSNGRSGAHYRHPDWRDDPGLIKSGFTFVGVDAYVQDIIKGIIIVAAVTIDMRRNRKNTNLINERQRRRMPLPPVLSRNKQNTPAGLRLSVLPRCASCTVSPLPLSIRQGPRVACGFWSRMNTPSFGKFSPRWLAEKGALSSRCSRGWRSALGRGMNLPARGLP